MKARRWRKQGRKSSQVEPFHFLASGGGTNEPEKKTHAEKRRYNPYTSPSPGAILYLTASQFRERPTPQIYYGQNEPTTVSNSKCNKSYTTRRVKYLLAASFFITYNIFTWLIHITPRLTFPSSQPTDQARQIK